jgi:hypothetical protein
VHALSSAAQLADAAGERRHALPLRQTRPAKTTMKLGLAMRLDMVPFRLAVTCASGTGCANPRAGHTKTQIRFGIGRTRDELRQKTPLAPTLI